MDTLVLMDSWPNSRILNLLGIRVPIIQAPMAGATLSEMVIAVSESGGLGSLPCGMLTADQVRSEVSGIRKRTSKPVNLNFFCHQNPQADPYRETMWRQHLEKYYAELGLNPEAHVSSPSRMPFDGAMCDLLAEVRPEVVSFHFGLPPKDLLARVRATGAKIVACATTVDEARWLEREGCDAIIAQGYEAGGHRGMFLNNDIATQVGTMSLVPQVVDAVKLPVIAAGGIADARGIAAAFLLGASAVQMGTVYLLCPESTISPAHRKAVRNSKDDSTVLTNVFTGRPARGFLSRFVREVGPVSELAPEFPLAAGALASLRLKSEEAGSQDFTPMWAGQAAPFAKEIPAGELTRQLAADALAQLTSR
jgi:nitronate monooxygenase